MKELIFLFFGAAGALLAIFLKEAVQHALQRRVIAWQLGGYLLAWKANIVNEGQLVQLYNTVEERLKRLIVSYEMGIAVFQAQHLEQTKVRDDIRESIRKALESTGGANPTIDLDELMKSNLERAVMGLSERRSLLLDSKTFVSDKDAAMLGRAAAMNVIQFRTAMTDAITALEHFVRLGSMEGDKKVETIARLADQLIVQGERALIAFIRLEANAERISQRSVPQLVYDVLRGR